MISIIMFIGAALITGTLWVSYSPIIGGAFLFLFFHHVLTLFGIGQIHAHSSTMMQGLTELMKLQQLKNAVSELAATESAVESKVLEFKDAEEAKEFVEKFEDFLKANTPNERD